MFVRTLVLMLTILPTVFATASVKDRWIGLFDGTDLTGWTVGRSPWTVDNGILRNTRGQDADWIIYDTLLPETQFAFEVRVRVIDGMRFRAHVAFDGIYIGNEGSTRQFEVYGGDISNVRQVGEDSYVTGQWYTLRLEVDSADNVRLFKDGVLTHTATRTRRVPSQITVQAGDAWSEGHIELSSIGYWRLPQPIVADSVADFSGTQGYRNWYYGFYDGPFTSSGFKVMPIFDPLFGPPGTWRVDYVKYWTGIWRDGMHPNGPAGPEKLPTEQWAVRRWLCTVEGTVSISGHYFHNQWDDPGSACGDGATAHILVDGSEVWAQWVSGTDFVGLFYSIDTACHVGSLVDFVLSPGTNAFCDHFVYTSLIGPSAEPIADLRLSKSGDPDPVYVGSNMTYSLSVANYGPDGATNATLVDQLPATAAFVSATASQGTCSEVGGVVTAQLGQIANGASATVAIVVTPSLPGTITNAATVTASEDLPDPPHNTATVSNQVEPAANLWLSKSASPDPVYVGSDLTYNVSVNNRGPSAATDVIVTDTLPQGATFVSAISTQGTVAELGGVVTAQLGEIANTGNATVTIVVRPTTPGQITNTASVSAVEYDPDPSHHTDSAETQVIERPATVLVTPSATHYERYVMRQGWYDGNVAWFTCLSTNDIGFASSGGWAESWSPLAISPPTLSPKLSSALVASPEKAARPIYIVTNAEQGPVFSTRPGDPDYSGLWQVFYVKWHPGFRRGITNTRPASSTNPAGFPAYSEADILESQIVLDCPVLALGQLGGPWLPAEDYRIPQGRDYTTAGMLKWISLPHFPVFTQDRVRRNALVADLMIADVSDAALAEAIGANYAPALDRIPPEHTQSFWIMTQPMPPSQLPLIDELPGPSVQEFNPGYSPVMSYIVLQRRIPAYTVVSNNTQLNALFKAGRLIELRRDQRIKAQVILRR